MRRNKNVYLQIVQFYPRIFADLLHSCSSNNFFHSHSFLSFLFSLLNHFTPTASASFSTSWRFIISRAFWEASCFKRSPNLLSVFALWELDWVFRVSHHTISDAFPLFSFNSQQIRCNHCCTPPIILTSALIWHPFFFTKHLSPSLLIHDLHDLLGRLSVYDFCCDQRVITTDFERRRPRNLSRCIPYVH